MDALEIYFHEEKKRKIKNYKKLNRFVKKGQVLFAGSSLMEQFPIYELMIGRVSNKMIYNRGVGGYTTLEMMSSLDTCVFDLEPSKIFINIGTNDLNGQDYKQETLIENYDKILTEIKKGLPNTQIYIMAYYPVNKDVSDNPWMKVMLAYRTNERIAQANKELEKLALRKGAKYIDVNKNLYDENGCLKKEFAIDGVHMFGDGYEAILDELLKYVNE